jgi:hypothetical protein
LHDDTRTDAWTSSTAGCFAELKHEQVQPPGSSINEIAAMHVQARQTLNELRSLSNIEKYLNTARAELASDPCDDRLRAFIAAVEGLLQEEKGKLGQGSQAA